MYLDFRPLVTGVLTQVFIEVNIPLPYRKQVFGIIEIFVRFQGVWPFENLIAHLSAFDIPPTFKLKTEFESSFFQNKGSEIIFGNSGIYICREIGCSSCPIPGPGTYLVHIV